MCAHVYIEVSLLKETLFTLWECAFVFFPRLLVWGREPILTTGYDTMVILYGSWISRHEAIIGSMIKLL